MGMWMARAGLVILLMIEIEQNAPEGIFKTYPGDAAGSWLPVETVCLVRQLSHMIHLATRKLTVCGIEPRVTTDVRSQPGRDPYR